MIETSIAPFRRHLGQTIFVVLAFAFALAVPGALIFSSYSGVQLTGQWIEKYSPMVYMNPAADESETQKLADEIASWTNVRTVELRPPQKAYEAARERVGEQELSDVGVEPEMFPYSLVIIPKTRWGNDVELVSRVRAVESREQIDTVDVPSQRASRILESLWWGMTVGVVLLVLGGVFAVYLVTDFLSRLQRTKRRELSILERYGAEPRTLRRGTWIRGVLVGLWAGLAAFAFLLVVAIAWRSLISGLWSPLTVERYWHWLVVGTPLWLAPLIGTAIGFWVARSGRDQRNRLPEGLESMLDYSSRRGSEFRP